MLSYRHAFHAGNHADVLKHWVMVLCLQYMKRKDKPFLYLDTHAGAGLYPLSNHIAEKNGEYKEGIERLWNQPDTPAAFEDYLAVVRYYNERSLIVYPGSAAIATHLLRTDDRLALAELHPADIKLLQSHLGNDKRLSIFHSDGFQQVKALLPPPSRRGLVLIDPPYELKDDYSRVITALKDGLKRFATGTYLVWYPLLNAPYSQRFASQLQALPNIKWLNIQLMVRSKPNGPGMYGSGMFVINPPYTLQGQMQQGLPWLAEKLACDDRADSHLAYGE